MTGSRFDRAERREESLSSSPCCTPFIEETSMRKHHDVRWLIRIVFFVWDLELAMAAIALAVILAIVFT